MYRGIEINKEFRGFKALDNISVEIPEGKLTCIIGPNGAGKSTLLGVLSRILKHDSGKVVLEGKEMSLWETTELSKTLSIMKQLNNINIRLSIYDLVAFGRYPYSQGKLGVEDKKIIKEALEYTGLYEIKDKYLDELSGGQKQRAYISMVLAQDTKYILLDEPLNNLDIKHILEVMHLLKKLVEEKEKSIVIVVHDINIASTFGDFIIAMKSGALVAKGKPEEIINKEVLYKIYDIDFHIEKLNNKLISLYY